MDNVDAENMVRKNRTIPQTKAKIQIQVQTLAEITQYMQEIWGNEKEKYTRNIIFPACMKVDAIKKRKQLYTQMRSFATNTQEKYKTIQ